MKLTIEKLDHMGNGIGYYNNKIVFIPFTIPEDEVEFEIVKENKNYINGKLIKIINKSPNRIEPFCEHFGICGGCQLQNLDYNQTIEYKKNRVENILNRIGIKKNVTIIRNIHPVNYRNKIELKIVDQKIGFYKNNSHDLIEVKECKITKNCINNFIKELKKMNLNNADVMIRCNYNDELLVSIDSIDEIKIKNDYSENKVVGIIFNGKCIYGEDHFLDKISNIFFEVSYDSFFQVNSYINEKLFEIIQDNVGGDSVLDLYSGVGTLSLMASKKAKQVYAIEIIPNAVVNALKNAKINNIKNINFVLGKVEDKIDLIKDKIDAVIVDPPRKGLDDYTISKILEIKPQKIIYISCETQKLTEDLKRFINNYKVKSIIALDMFSYTYHCETICVLERI